jgi:hypothetical protein
VGTIDKFRAVFADMAIRSVYHNVARLDAARAPVALMLQWRQDRPNNRPPTRATAISEMGHLPRFRPLASCRRRLLARVEGSLWPASATLHMSRLMRLQKRYRRNFAPEARRGSRGRGRLLPVQRLGGMTDALD